MVDVSTDIRTCLTVYMHVFTVLCTVRCTVLVQSRQVNHGLDLSWKRFDDLARLGLATAMATAPGDCPATKLYMAIVEQRSPGTLPASMLAS